MRVVVCSSAGEVARAAAVRIADTLRRLPEPVLVLAAGKTMIPIYRELVRLHRSGRAPFRRARTFNVDELRVAPDDLRSLRRFMDRHLLGKIDLPSARIHFLRGDAADPKAESRRFEREFERFGPPDLALLGIGENGHIAYLEPATSLPPRTSLVRLSPATRRGLVEDGIRPAPDEALTMGIETILSAREVLLVATGISKAKAVSCALEGPVTPACPASFLSLHPGLTVLLDRASASELGPPRRFSSKGTAFARDVFRKERTMPEKETLEHARQDKEEGKAPSTQAGEFVREEMHHVREGKHGARSTKQAIAIGLSKARRAGVELPPPKEGTTPEETREKAARDVQRGKAGSKRKPSARRSRAVSRALKREGRSAASEKALSRQARSAAARRSKSSRSRAAKKAAATRKKK